MDVAVAALAILVLGCKKQDAPLTKQELEHKMAGAQPGEEREIDPNTFMTMYRSQATAPTTGGWHHAVSTKGGFAVDIPIAFNDFRIRGKADDHVDFMLDNIGAKSPGMLSWGAMCGTRADGKPYAKSQLPTTDTTEQLGTPVRAWQRTIPQTNGRVCLLIVEAQGSDPLPPEADIQRFLRSFEQTR